MNSVQRSAPIDIQNAGNSGLTGSHNRRERHDTISRIKSELNSRNRYNSNSLSPDLSSPTPPTFVPDGSHEASQLDNYLLVEQVGGHNCGNVYRAVDVDTEREYICKVYETKNYRKHLEPYTHITEHPNINQIVDIVQGITKTYIFFQPGIAEESNTQSFQADNLHSLVRSKGSLSETDAAVLFKQIVEAVNHCHQHNIVVRDLKLRKFIFKDHERTQVMMESLDDACILSSTDDIMSDKHGCPAYVSPEILACSAAALSKCPNSDMSGYSGKASDVWCLGVMLYTLLVGRYPFQDSDISSLFCKIRRAMYSIPDKLSTQAKDLIHCMLQRDISCRLKTHEILKHPWIVKQGHCWDEPRFVMPIGNGGDQRITTKPTKSWAQVVPQANWPSYDYGDEQLVPDSYVSEEDETMFDF